MADQRVDIIVIGAGPAGSGAAGQLARWGRRVALLTGPPATRPPLAESLPPSCGKPLAALGLLELVENAGFLRARGNSAAWADGRLSAEPYAAGAHGWQIVRDRFDALLLDAAAQSGVRILHGARAARVDLAAAEHADVAVTWSDPLRSGTLRAPWVLDCSGGAGVIARQGLRQRDAGAMTVAIAGVWRRPGGFAVADDSHTLVEAYADGWAWSVPIAHGARCVAVMIDPRRTRLVRGAGRHGLYRGELAKTSILAALLAGARLDGQPWACNAAGYAARRCAGPGYLLVGDAASFLDPLSSAGVKKALASAHLAAVATHTCCRRPALRTAALELYDAHERSIHARYLRLAADHYAAAAGRFATPYWHARASAPAAAIDDDAAGSLAESDPRVLRAFAALRARPTAKLRPAAQLRRRRRAIVAGREIVLADHLVSPLAPKGVRYFRGIELPAVIDAAVEPRSVPDLYEAYRRRDPTVVLPDFLGAVSALVAFGMLEPAAASPHVPISLDTCTPGRT